MSLFSSIGNAIKGVVGAVAPVALGAATGGASTPLWASVLGNVGGNLLNSAVSGHFARENMEKQMKLQKELFAYENLNKHQFEVQDLKAAGLNPILSAMNGSSVGVGGIGISNPISQDNPFSSAMQMHMARKEVDINQQNANTNSLVGASSADRNYKEGLLAEANANSAVKMLPWMEKKQETDIANSKKVADAQATYYYVSGAAQQLQATAAAADHYANIEETLERKQGYAGQREGQRIKNIEDLAEHGFRQWRRELVTGRRSPESAYDVWRGFMDYAK